MPPALFWGNGSKFEEWDPPFGNPSCTPRGLKHCFYNIPVQSTLYPCEFICTRKICLNSSWFRVQGLTIGECAWNCNNWVPRGSKVSATDVTVKTFFEHLYWVLGLRQFASWVNCLCARTPPPFNQQIFLDLYENLFPEWPLKFFLNTIHFLDQNQ